MRLRRIYRPLRASMEGTRTGMGLGRRTRTSPGGDISAGRSSEGARVFAAELGDAYVAHVECGRLYRCVAEDHETAGFMKAELLLILKRRHSRHRLELTMKCRGTHVSRNGEVRYANGVFECVSNPVNGLDDPLIVTVRQDHNLADLIAFRASQEPITYLAHDSGIER